MKIIIQRDTAIAEALVSDEETPNGYRHVIITAQADTAANAADLAREITDMFVRERDTWWRTRLESRQEGKIGTAFVRFSYALRPGVHREYDPSWRTEHASLLGFK